jgi:ElaB/YqjD/DUF883 family membrane-anchored ribosome-binding protein
MDNETQIIRHQMFETRTALTQKLETLEEKVTDTVQGVKDRVQETVDTVKEAFNIGHQVQKHPWAMFGGSVLVGCLGGYLFPPRKTWQRPLNLENHPVSHQPRAQGIGSGPECRDGYAAEQSLKAAARPVSNSPEPGLLDSLADKYAEEINKLKGLAIGTVTAVVRDMMATSLPKEIGAELSEVMDSITAKLGGKPIHDPVFQGIRSNGSSPDWPSTCDPSKEHSDRYSHQQFQVPKLAD